MKIKYPIIFIVFLFFWSPAKAITDIEFQFQIQALLQQIAILQEQLNWQQNQATTTWCYNFTKNLRIEDKNYDVGQLKQALQRQGSDLFDDNNFDEKTASAVSEFQEKYADEILTPSRLRKGTGYVGPATRKKLNELYGCKKAIIVEPQNLNEKKSVIAVPKNLPELSEIIYFHWDTCPYCAGVNRYIRENNIEQKVKITKLETSKNEDNRNLQIEKSKLCGFADNFIKVPFVWDGKNCFVGLTDVINFFSGYKNYVR